MGKMPTSLTYCWMTLLSFVPQRYRAKSSLEGSRGLLVAAGLSGFFQTIIFSFFFIAAFINQAAGIWEAISGVVLEGEKGPFMDPLQVRLTTGVLGVTTFLLRPTSLLFAYLAAEGSVRAFGAFALGHVVPTLPLYLISAVHDRVGARARRKKVATLARDVIEPARDSTYDLHVLSSRREQEWMTSGSIWSVTRGEPTKGTAAVRLSPSKCGSMCHRLQRRPRVALQIVS